MSKRDEIAAEAKLFIKSDGLDPFVDRYELLIYDLIVESGSLEKGSDSMDTNTTLKFFQDLWERLPDDPILHSPELAPGFYKICKFAEAYCGEDE